MSNLKNLINKFGVNKTDVLNDNQVNDSSQSTTPEIPVSNNTTVNDDQYKITMRQRGHSESSACQGNPLVFKTSLAVVYQQFRERIAQDTHAQELMRAPLIATMQNKQNEIRAKEVLLENKKIENQGLDSKIQETEMLIHDVRQNPSKHGIPTNQNPSPLFWIGLTILIGLTIYLFIYYSSVFYSCLYKEYSENTEIIEAFLDGHALQKAPGFMAVIILLTIPFVFLGLGFLIHMYNRKKNDSEKQTTENKKFKLEITHWLLIVTFIFDALLAGVIAKHMFDATAVAGQTFNLIDNAIVNPDFWIVIFCGFLVYVIWGYVFDFVMKEHELKDKIKLKIIELTTLITNLTKEKSVNQELIENAKNEILALQKDINTLQSDIHGVIIPQSQYRVYHAEFVNGWFFGISSLPISSQDKNDLIQRCETVSNEFLVELQANTVPVGV